MRWTVALVLLTAACSAAPGLSMDGDESASSAPSSSTSSSSTGPGTSSTTTASTNGEAGESGEGSESGLTSDPPDPDLGDGGQDLPPPFADASVEHGLDVIHSDLAHPWSPPGQAWADLNRDGFLDVVLTNQHLPNRLLFGGPGGQFAAPFFASDIALADQISGGAVIGDYDDDGWPDLYILNFGANVLFRNLGGQGFEDVTETAGVGDLGVGETAAFGDFDGDGFLDLYVANNDVASPDPLYRNNGAGAFVDASHLLDPDINWRPSFSASFFDYDLDGDLDLYVAVDKQLGNVLWRNDGPGCGGWCLTDVSVESGAGVELCSMGIAVGDYDNDGDQDLFATSIGDMPLLQNQSAQGEPVFVEVTMAAAAVIDVNGWGEVGWGAQFLDYDNDGWLDLYVGLGKEDAGPEIHNVLFHNLGDGSFAVADQAGGAEDGRLSWSVGAIDFDADGWQDLLVGNRGDRYTLYRNRRGDFPDAPHYLSVELRTSPDDEVAPDAIGARLTLTDSAGRHQTRELLTGSSLALSSSLIAHFGLGDALPTALTVTWPNGLVQQLANPPVDTCWVVDYPG